MYFYATLDPSPARRARAQEALNASQRLAPNAPETRLAAGNVAYLCEGDWTRALAEFRAAEMGLPNEAAVVHKVGLAHRRLGHWLEAETAFERAANLNPHDLFIGHQLGNTRMMLHRYPEALEAGQRYFAYAPNDALVYSRRIRAQFAVDGDKAAYLRARQARPRFDDEAQELQAEYEDALLGGETGSAARLLEKSGIPALPNMDSGMSDPISLHRAMVATLNGNRTAAEKHAEEAMDYYRTRQWMPSQRRYVELGIARAEAYANQIEAAVRDAKAALQQVVGKDAYAEITVRFEVARIYAALNLRRETLAALTELVAGQCWLSPNELRVDPFLSRFKDDPRFEEILKSAKPL